MSDGLRVLDVFPTLSSTSGLVIFQKVGQAVLSRFLVYVDSHSPSLKAIPWEENKLLVKLCEILLLPKVPFSSSAGYQQPFSLL